MSIKKLFIGAVSALLVSSASAGLVNGGFEDSIIGGGPPFVGTWTTFSNGSGASAGLSTGQSRSGLQSLLLSIENTDNTFAGVFQDIAGFSSGDSVEFQGWHKTVSDPLDLTVEIRIEWRNAVSDTEVSRTGNLSPVPGMDYSSWSLFGVVPTGADVARVVYAIQTFTGGSSNDGDVHIDDLSLRTVPEPSSLMLVCVGGLAPLRRRATQPA